MTTETTITASFTFHGQEFKDVDVVNPGAWFGTCWLLEIGGSYSSFFVVVEAGSASDAIDELIDSGKGDALKIDESAYADYGVNTDSPSCYFAGNNGHPVDLGDLLIHGDDRAGFSGVLYHVPGWPVPVKPDDLQDVQNKMDSREHYLADVSSPGKFEGEQAYVPYFWDAYLDGCADDDDGTTLTFNVTDDDRLMFPELEGVDHVYLAEDDDGFVCEVHGPADPVDPEPTDDDSDDDNQELDDVVIPGELLDLASSWYSGQDDMLYALSSTGDISLGSRRPYSDFANRPMTDREWHIHLWNCLESDVRRAAQCAEKSNHEDASMLRTFEEFCEETVTELRIKYGLEDSDAV